MLYLFLADGCEETEAVATLDVMRRASLNVKTVGITGETVTSSHGVTITADLKPDEIEFDQMGGVILPGGMPGTRYLAESECVRTCVEYCYKHSRIIAAICAAPMVLGELGILNGKRATSHPSVIKSLAGAEYTGEHVTVDGNIITGKGAGCAVEFGHAIVSKVLSKKDADKVLGDMQCL